MKTIKYAILLLLLITLTASVCFAQTAATGQPINPPSFSQVFQRMLPMFAIVFFIFYFVVMKPAQAKIKTQQTLLEALKRGDEVVTSSGMIGRVAGSEKGYIILEVAPNVKIKVEAAHVTKRYEELAQAPSVEKAKA